jgi:hypothetical protein
VSAFVALAFAGHLLDISAEPTVPDASLTGRITLNGAPVPRATVILTKDLPASDIWPGGPPPQPAADQVLTVRADADGGFRIERLPARQWHLYVQHPGVTPHAGTVTISQPPAATRFDLELKPAPIVRGRVLDPAGRPVAGVTVRFTAETGSSFHYPNPRTRTDRRGYFEIGQAAVGKGWLEAYTPDGRMAADQIDVAAGESVHNLALVPANDPGTVRLRVIGNHGHPLAGAWIGYGPEVRTDAAGRWRTRRYSPSAPVPPLSVSWRNEIFQIPHIRLPQAAGTEVVQTIPDGMIDVDISSGDLWLHMRGPGPARRAPNPDKKTARFHLLAAGRWTLRVHHPDHRMGQMEIDLGPGKSKRVSPPLDRPGRTVVGRFVDRKRPGWRMYVETTCWTLPYRLSPEGKVMFDDAGLGDQRVPAAPDGRFTLLGLHPGRHVIFIEESSDWRRAIFLVVPESGSDPIDLGDVRPTGEPSDAYGQRLLFASEEGVVMEYPELRPRLRELRPGDLVVEIDGHRDLKDWEARALLDDPGPHRAVVRAAAKTITVRCPPAPPNSVLPTRIGFNRGTGTTPPLLVGQLAPDHPWNACLQPDDLLSAVLTDPRVVRTFNSGWREPLDNALASGKPEVLEVQRRGPPRQVDVKPLPP